MATPAEYHDRVAVALSVDLPRRPPSSPWWESGVSTETGEAPVGQGATTENIGDI
jgi:hypothetical protein